MGSNRQNFNWKEYKLIDAIGRMNFPPMKLKSLGDFIVR